jgi:hypothetical protein
MSEPSPYMGLETDAWESTTKKLVAKHPIKATELVEVVLASWEAIFQSKIGIKRFKIGTHIFPKPQIMGFFLHELIALEFANRYPELWRGEQSSADKDLVFLQDARYSIEIKTSSDRKNIFGNRSFAQKTTGTEKKDKSGYYLQVNFEKFSEANKRPSILQIKFGWLDHADWIGQTASTGQQARLSPETAARKLLTIYELK